MNNIGQMALHELLDHSFRCDCGRIHNVDIKAVYIESNALAKVPELIRDGGWTKAFVIADGNTYAAAGEKLVEHLTAAGIPYSKVIFADSALVPDEHAIGRIMMRFDPACDVIIGVGAGTINDMSRFTSFRLGVPYMIVATAPSMDGYASTVAPLITNNLKTTYEAVMPKAIIADLDVLTHAPQEMIAAGFGDILGKYTCLVDWKLSSIINGEYYCETVVEMMRTALNRTIALKEGLAQRDKEALQKLMEALVLAGVAMSYVGNSRPASGCEHHMSHFWEMRYLFEGRKPVLHGAKVGMSCRLALKLHDYLRSENLTAEDLLSRSIEFDYSSWKAEMERAYGKGAPEIIELEEQTGKNSFESWNKRLHSTADHWDEIQAIISDMPASEDVAALLTCVKGPAYPHQVGLTAEALWDGVMYAKELRSRYTVLQLLWDINLLQQYADRLVSEEFPVSK